MTNIFEQPYTLIGLSIIVLFGLFTYRSVFPEKANRKQWLIPLSVVFLAFALDFVVKTDREKVTAVLNAFMDAVEQEDIDAIARTIAPDYADSHHPDKTALIARCRKSLADIHIRKLTETSGLLDVSPPTAKATLFVTAKFEKESWVTQSYRPILFFKGDFNCAKQPDNSWKITKITPREVDKQPITWSQIRY